MGVVNCILFYFYKANTTHKKKKARVLQSVNQMYLDLENKLVFKTLVHFEIPYSVDISKHKRDQ